MITLNLHQAAEFLQMNPETLRRKAKMGSPPGKKAGKRWIFVQEHLADWVSGRYPEHPQKLQVINGKKEAQQCQSTNAAKPGGYNSPIQTEKEYSNLLAQKQKKRRKSYTTN